MQKQIKTPWEIEKKNALTLRTKLSLMLSANWQSITITESMRSK